LDASNDMSQPPPGDLASPGDGVFRLPQWHSPRRASLTCAYWALFLFMIIYCARPQDWVSGLTALPLAKIAGALALLSFFFSVRQVRRPLPHEVILLILLVGQLLTTVPMSTVWPGGAFWNTLDFAKVLIIFIVIVTAVNTARRLRGIILVQSASVVAVASVAVWRGRLSAGRLEGLLGGSYTNPNDLALSAVLTLPLCLALLFVSRSRLERAAWTAAILLLIYTMLLTGSRGGFLSLAVAFAMCLWEFGIRGRRRYLLLLAALVVVAFWQSSSAGLVERLKGTFNAKQDATSSYGSAQKRQQLFWRSIEVTEDHPLFGVGPGNFQVISGNWQVTHNSFTQMSAEGGLPALALYVWILWRGFRNLKAIKRFAQGRRTLNVLASGLKASLAAYAVGSFFASTAYLFAPYFLVAYTTALFWIARTSSIPSKVSKSLGRAALSSNFRGSSSATVISCPT
jgi:O-antigen ligase